MKDNKSYNVTVRLTAEDKEALEKYAKENEVSMSQVLRKAVKDYIKTTK